MLPWVQVHSTLREHHKIDDLTDELKLKTRYEAVGIVVSLWLWAVNNALDGDISKYKPRSIASATDWKGKPEALVEALVKVGFLDRTETALKIHDWDEYTMLYAEKEEIKREKTRERVTAFRNRKKCVTPTEPPKEPTLQETPCNAHVTVTGVTGNEDGNANVTASNALHNITEPIHNITVNNMEEGITLLQGAESVTQAGNSPSSLPPENGFSADSLFPDFWAKWGIISHEGEEDARAAWAEVITSQEDAEWATFHVGTYWAVTMQTGAKRLSAAEWLRKGAWR